MSDNNIVNINELFRDVVAVISNPNNLRKSRQELEEMDSSVDFLSDVMADPENTESLTPDMISELKVMLEHENYMVRGTSSLLLVAISSKSKGAALLRNNGIGKFLETALEHKNEDVRIDAAYLIHHFAKSVPGSGLLYPELINALLPRLRDNHNNVITAAALALLTAAKSHPGAALMTRDDLDPSAALSLMPFAAKQSGVIWMRDPQILEALEFGLGSMNEQLRQSSAEILGLIASDNAGAEALRQSQTMKLLEIRLDPLDILDKRSWLHKVDPVVFVATFNAIGAIAKTEPGVTLLRPSTIAAMVAGLKYKGKDYRDTADVRRASARAFGALACTEDGTELLTAEATENLITLLKWDLPLAESEEIAEVVGIIAGKGKGATLLRQQRFSDVLKDGLKGKNWNIKGVMLQTVKALASTDGGAAFLDHEIIEALEEVKKDTRESLLSKMADKALGNVKLKRPELFYDGREEAMRRIEVARLSIVSSGAVQKHG